MPITPIITGATKKIRVNVKQDGAVLDISSDTVHYFLKTLETDDDDDALVDVDADVVTAGSSGIADITIPKATTVDLTKGKKYYEIFLERSGGEEYILKTGEVYVIGRITDI